MRAALPIAASLLATLLACASPVEVVVDGHDDFSHHRTWDWLPDSRPNVQPRDVHSLMHDWRVAKRVEQDLHEKGFERSSQSPDFFVSYRLALRPRRIVVDEPWAPYQLSSHNASPSYIIQGSTRSVVDTLDVALWLNVADATGREIWGGTLRRLGDTRPYTVDDAVQALCERLPARQIENDLVAEDDRVAQDDRIAVDDPVDEAIASSPELR